MLSVLWRGLRTARDWLFGPMLAAPVSANGLAVSAGVVSTTGAAVGDERSAAAPGLPPRRQGRWRRWRAWLLARTRRFTTAAAATNLVLFAGLALLVQAGLTAQFDLAVTRGLQALEHPAVGAVMLGVSQFGFMPLGFWIVALAGAALWRARRRLEAALLVAGGAGGVLAEIIKVALMRPRPSADQVRVAAELAGHSFPSGHTLMYVGFFGFLFYLAYARLRPGLPRTAALLTCGALIALVGASRVYLGQHWPTDVLASYLLGLAYLLVLVRVYLWRKLAVPTERVSA